MNIPGAREELRLAEASICESLGLPTVSAKMNSLHNLYLSAAPDRRDAIALAALARVAIASR